MGLLSSFVLSVFLDTHSTCMSLSRGNREVLLPFSTCRGQILYNSISSSSIILFNQKFKKNHPRLTKFIYIASIASHSLAAYHNYRISK